MQQNINDDQQEISDIWTLNQKLTKKVHARQQKIKNLFIGSEQSQKAPENQENLISMINKKISKDRLLQKSYVIKTDIKKREKSVIESNKKNVNIFKKQSSNVINVAKHREDNERNLKLPTIQKNVQQNPERGAYEDYMTLSQPKRQKSEYLNEQNKKRIYKLPLDKLVPLTQEQLKKRIQSKFR